MTLQCLTRSLLGDEQARKRRGRYRQALLLPLARSWPRDAIVLDYDGEPHFAARRCRPISPACAASGINMEFNGALCRGLKNTRYKEMEMVDGEPTLVDFIMDRVAALGPHAGFAL